ncbi:MAG: VTT domain-containing protein [Lactobacillales bacterium]|jgi:membrane-associated protein|nr:VTT domain-containing protein [Lactobacillales bacterium]
MPILFLNFNEVLQNLLNQHILYFYLVLITIIFVETGIVIFPFLPGDSILFFAGSLAALKGSEISIWFLIISLSITAFIANMLNFELGKRFGESLPKHPKLNKFLKPKHIEEAHAFFEKYGTFAIFLGRFMPIIRTIVPFTAGSSLMPYKKFVTFNFLGGVTWCVLSVGAGFLFGQVPFVKKHFEVVMLAIVFISLLPVVIMAVKRWFKNK